MDLLRELSHTRQVPGEPRRRWFNSPELDLIVWLGDDDSPNGFQLCYDKLRRERALTWRVGRGYDHTAVDSGENGQTVYKATPILVADGLFESDKVKEDFLEASAEIPEEIRTFVAGVLDRYPRE